MILSINMGEAELLERLLAAHAPNSLPARTALADLDDAGKNAEGLYDLELDIKPETAAEIIKGLLNVPQRAEPEIMVLTLLARFLGATPTQRGCLLEPLERVFDEVVRRFALPTYYRSNRPRCLEGGRWLICAAAELAFAHLPEGSKYSYTLSLPSEERPLARFSWSVDVEDFKAGWDACRAGKLTRHSPGNHQTSQQWLRGWRAAFKQAERTVAQRSEASHEQ